MSNFSKYFFTEANGYTSIAGQKAYQSRTSGTTQTQVPQTQVPQTQTTPAPSEQPSEQDTHFLVTLKEFVQKRTDITSPINKLAKQLNNNQNLNEVQTLPLNWYLMVYNNVLIRENTSKWLDPSLFPYYCFIDFIIYYFTSGGEAAVLSYDKTVENFAPFITHINAEIQKNGNNSILNYTPYTEWLKARDGSIKKKVLEQDADSLGYFFIMECIKKNMTVLEALTEAVNIAEGKFVLKSTVEYVLNNPMKNTVVPKTKGYLASIAKSIEEISVTTNATNS